MAVSDEEWKKFLDSTEEDPEEVETEDDSEDETEDEEQEDQGKPAKKSETEEEDEGASDDEEDSEEEDDSEDDDDAEEAEDTYKPRLKQFLKSDGSLDPKKIEEAYITSGKEAVRLNKELETANGNYDNLLAAIKAKPEAAKLLFGEEGAKKLASDSSIPTGGSGKGTDLPDHPLLKHLEAQMNNSSRAEYESFVDAHPEAVTDPEKAKKIGSFLKTHGSVYREEHNGEIPSMKESLEAAYRYYGWDLEIENKEAVATAAKKAAATRKSGGGKKPATKKQVSKGEQFFAQKLGVKLKS